MLSLTPKTEAATKPWITGNVGYTAYSAMQRNAQFNGIATSNSCSYAWNVTESFVVAFVLDGDVTPYAHDAFLTQTGSSVSGNGGHVAGGPHTYTWHVTSGTVTGNTITLHVTYDTGAPGTVMTMTGTIAPNGTMSGTWTDNFGGSRTGTWSTTSGTAKKTYGGGCTAAGIFSYSDASGKFYIVSVKYVSTSLNKGWMAGPVIWGNVGMGSWLFAEMKDNANPGAGSDQLWGSFTTETLAKTGVATMTDPTDGPFTITSGDLRVK